MAAGILPPAFGIPLGPVVAGLATSLSSVSVIGNALRLRMRGGGSQVEHLASRSYPARRLRMTSGSARSILAAFAMGALVMALAGPALAQQPAAGKPSTPGARMQQSMPAGTGGPDDSASTQAFKAADARMMKNMDRPMSGNADRDFVAEMLPHHQGAIEMARVELRYGHDPHLRRLARDIISAQEKEIATMHDWQRRHPT